MLAAVIEALGAVAAWCTQNRGAVAELLSQGTGVPLAATRRAVDRTDYVIGPMTDRVAADPAGDRRPLPRPEADPEADPHRRRGLDGARPQRLRTTAHAP